MVRIWKTSPLSKSSTRGTRIWSKWWLQSIFLEGKSCEVVYLDFSSSCFLGLMKKRKAVKNLSFLRFNFTCWKWFAVVVLRWPLSQVMHLGMTPASASPMQHLFLLYRPQLTASRRQWLLSNLQLLFSLDGNYLKLLLLYFFQIYKLACRGDHIVNKSRSKAAALLVLCIWIILVISRRS